MHVSKDMCARIVFVGTGWKLCMLAWSDFCMDRQLFSSKAVDCS